ncbi:TGS domain-containing protein [Candidatus Micrarchaeota archaeon]|nr:TGS domain-containing protein [Candidatus Micrarchaeota archaeon]MBU2476949.1 TGS domain-containing protein [Candidatus Micrarchaeota archaeon]
MKYKDITPKKLLGTIKGQDYVFVSKALELAKKELQEKILRNKVNCAFVLSSLGLKKNSMCSVLLFPTKLKEEEIEKEFSAEVKDLVEAIRKIEKIESQRGNFSQEALSKIILATTKDIRTIITVLALQLCRLRTATKINTDLAEKALNVYAPISQKLGLNELKWELEDLSFKILKPKEYQKIRNSLKMKKKERDKNIKKIVNEIKKELKKEKIEAKVLGRTKNFYGIYKKMSKKNFALEDLHDLMGVRIICNTIKECYIILGIIHSMYEPLLNSFDDYIANPKENNYKSIHTDLKTKDEKIFEAQIRTWKMNAEAEEGMPAHWAYKEIKEDKEFDGKLTWAKQLIEWNRKHKSKKIEDFVKIGFEEKNIFVLTPKSEIIELPEKSTPIDFAYAIHSNLGDKTHKAKVNGKIVSLDYELENGDIIEIITSKKQFPKRQWLSLVKTQKAKSKIRQALNITEKKTKKETKKLPEKPFHSIRIAKCCKPLPEDQIKAIKTTKRKLIIHRENCQNLLREEKKKIIPINWGMLGKRELSTEIKIKAKERANLLTEILDLFSSLNAKVASTQAKVNKNNVSCKFVLETKKPETIGKIMEKIKKLEGVSEVERI